MPAAAAVQACTGSGISSNFVRAGGSGEKSGFERALSLAAVKQVQTEGKSRYQDADLVHI